MSIPIKGTVQIAAIGGLFGVGMMVFWLATGGYSPEPRDHPGWWLRFLGTLPGHIMYLIVMFLSLPAFELTTIFYARWNIVFWLATSVVQFAMYFGITFGIAEFVSWLRSQ